MATTQQYDPNKDANATKWRDPAGNEYIVPLGQKLPKGWYDLLVGVQVDPKPAPLKLAQLKSSSGALEVVAVGGSRANELLDKGWVIDGSGKTPTDKASKDTAGGSGNPNQVNNSIAQSSKYILDGGDFYVVSMLDDPTPNNGIDETKMKWIYDVKKKVMRPISGREAEVALAKVMGVGAIPSVGIHSSDLSNKDTVFYGANFLPKSYAVQADGSFPGYPEAVMYKPDAVNPSQTATDQITGQIYGKDKLTAEAITPYVSTAMNMLKYALKSGDITQATYDKYAAGGKWNSQDFQDLVNAYAYGGYELDEIWRDVKAGEVGAKEKGFSRTMSADAYRKTNDYTANSSNTALVPSNTLSAELQSSKGVAVTALPPEAFGGGGMLGEKNKPSDIDEARKLHAAYYDILKMQATADTEADQARAQVAWEQFKTKVEKTYGVYLSKNATDAWAAINQIVDQASAAGLAGSGIANEQIQQKLRATQKADDIYRQEKTGKLTDEEMANAKKNYTPAQIKDLISRLDAEDKEAGLDPSQYRSRAFKATQSESDAYSIENLRKQYPLLNDDELKEIRSAYIDENGNRTSESVKTLGEKKYGLTSKNISAGITDKNAEWAAEQKRGTAGYSAALNKANPTTGAQFGSTPTSPTTPETKPSEVAKSVTTPETKPTTPTNTDPFSWQKNLATKANQEKGYAAATLYDPTGKGKDIAVYTSADAKTAFGQGYKLRTTK